eukprot:Lithocolla_globosa_v1_NODE_8540_length_809_cov_155.702918.p2 type:complete len:224 gc:universal NODE_8540_length_809_cov_155.702918:52-723(+)
MLLSISFLTVQEISLKISCNGVLPLVAVVKKLLFVVQQLLACLSGILKVRTFDNSINWTSLLAETTVDALCHVDVIAGGAAAAIIAFLGLDGDGLGGANGLAQLARNATLLSVGVSSQSMLATEARAERSFFKRVKDGVGRLGHLFETLPQPTHHFTQHQHVSDHRSIGFIFFPKMCQGLLAGSEEVEFFSFFSRQLRWRRIDLLSGQRTKSRTRQPRKAEGS